MRVCLHVKRPPMKKIIFLLLLWSCNNPNPSVIQKPITKQFKINSDSIRKDSIYKSEQKKFADSIHKAIEEYCKTTEFNKIHKKHPDWDSASCFKIHNNEIWIGEPLDMLIYEKKQEDKKRKVFSDDFLPGETAEQGDFMFCYPVYLDDKCIKYCVYDSGYNNTIILCKNEKVFSYNISKNGYVETICPLWSKIECNQVAGRKIFIGMTVDMLYMEERFFTHIHKSNYGNGNEYQARHGDSPYCTYFYYGDDGIITAYN